MESQTNKTISVCFALIRMLRQILPLIPKELRPVVVRSTVLSRLDYCNSLYLGAPLYIIQGLQRVQSIAAKLALNRKRSASSTQALRDLHWLPIKERVRFKSLCIVFRAVHDLGPVPLQEIFTWYDPKRQLRSSNTVLIPIPKFKRVRMGGRAFSVTAAQLWNELPQSLRLASTLLDFRKHLKTLLFPRT